MPRAWPEIDDPAVVEWLLLDNEAWLEALMARELPAREFSEDAYRHALAYPWERPTGSYLLRDGEVTPLDELSEDERREAVETYSNGRAPIVSFGANGSPLRLIEKCAPFEDPADREVLVLTGELHDVDVGPQPSATGYGSVPAALFASPGTAVRAAIVWMTPRQFTETARWELGYTLGRLDRARFQMDDADVAVEDLFAFVGRMGCVRLDGEPVALAAVPARDRTARALTQEELLDHYATIAIGPEARARDLVQLCFTDMRQVAGRLLPVTGRDLNPLPDDHWTRYPGP